MFSSVEIKCIVYLCLSYTVQETNCFLVIMMQESGGQGTDPMQASECPYNTQYSHSPGGITDPEYSIWVGIQNYVDCVRQAGCTSPQDLDKLKLSLQGYNYGNGYIGWQFGIMADTVRRMRSDSPKNRRPPMVGRDTAIRNMFPTYSGIILEGICLPDYLGAARWYRWRCHSLVMRADRSSGRGMDLAAGKSGALVSCPGARISAG